MNIYTHVNPDLDAVCSVWAARTFIPGAAAAKLILRPANWDGEGMKKGDLALDLEAGGRGIKGEKASSGIVHSCFAYLLNTYASTEAVLALANVGRFVDAQDAHGSAYRYLAPDLNPLALETFSSTGLNAVLRALQTSSDNDVFTLLDTILDGFLRAGLARLDAEREADLAELLPGGKVAIVRNARKFATNGILFETRGVRVIVYVDGFNLGLTRHSDEPLRMDHPALQAVVSAAGEAESWFAHPAGFLYCRGSRKSPATSSSGVDPRDLARAALGLLHG